jgi:hypothetical protein
MWDWLKAAQAIHALLAVLAAIGFFHFLIRTRFWFPRYAHYLGGFALALGLACLALMPPDAPINQGGWGGLKKALLVLVFPGLVYFFFVFYGGQRAAYERTHQPNAVPCPYCRDAHAVPGSPCPRCGQTVA